MSTDENPGMRLFRGSELRQEDADPAHFTGTARVTRTTGVSDEPGVTIYRVEFDPKARTDWHAHTGPQLLLILDGRCRIQTWGEAVRELEPGDTACVEPNEKHWHGAGADAAMTHIAVNIKVTTNWMEKVTDAQYDSSASSQRSAIS